MSRRLSRELAQEIRRLRLEQAETNRLLGTILEFAEHSGEVDDQIKRLEIQASERTARRSMGLAVVGIAAGIYVALFTLQAPEWILLVIASAAGVLVGIFWTLPAYFRNQERRFSTIIQMMAERRDAVD